MTTQQLIGDYNYEQGVIEIDNKKIYLTKLENKIFKILVNNYDKSVKNEKICKQIYGEDFDESFKKTLSTAVSRLRLKLKKYFIIQNRRGYGYTLRAKGDI